MFTHDIIKYNTVIRGTAVDFGTPDSISTTALIRIGKDKHLIFF